MPFRPDLLLRSALSQQRQHACLSVPTFSFVQLTALLSSPFHFGASSPLPSSAQVATFLHWQLQMNARESVISAAVDRLSTPPPSSFSSQNRPASPFRPSSRGVESSRSRVHRLQTIEPSRVKQAELSHD
uniref:Uncharacterized protein n=1 Tax=Cucumis melo TaxID=3656 RepID=A0A9I9CBX7_CUCME